MNIVHINTFDVGGAATAALRLHEGLLQQNINSSFLCLHKTGNKPLNKINFAQSYVMPAITERIKNKLGFGKATQHAVNETALLSLKGEYEKFSFPFTDYRVEENALIKHADIIHLHWIADFINYPTFFNTIQKPVVWTLHDMNPILGGFHYRGDEERNKTVFANLETKLITAKAKAVANLKNITTVTPSAWLNDAVKKSVIFNNADHKHIPYSLNCDAFKMHDKAFARNVFNLPANKKIIMFACENVSTYRKGYDLLRKAINQFTVSHEIILLTVGEPDTSLIQNDSIYNTGVIKDERLMSLLYAAADLFVLPSREDNFPNVMLEALACGTPVLSYKTGGMAEVIKEGINGFFADVVTADALADAIKDFCNGRYLFDTNTIRQTAIAGFSLAIQAQRYRELYKAILETGMRNENNAA